MIFKSQAKDQKSHLFALRIGIITLLTLMFYFVPVLISAPNPTASAVTSNVVTVFIVQDTVSTR